MIDSSLNLVDGLLEIIAPITILYNHLNPINYNSLYRLKNYYLRQKNSTNDYKKDSLIPVFSMLNVFIFVQKGLDYLTTFFSLNINFTFLIFFIRMRIMKRKVIFFPLLNDSEKFFQTGKSFLRNSGYSINNPTGQINSQVPNSSNSLNSLAKIDLFFAERRKKFAYYLFQSALANCLIFVNFVSLIDPFYGLKYFTNIYEFSYVNLKDSSNIKNKVSTDKFKKYSNTFNKRLIKNSFKFVIDIIFFFPIITIVVFTSPWNIFKFLQYVINKSITKPITRMRNFSQKTNTYPKKDDNNTIHFKHQKEFLSFICSRWVEGWILIIQVVLTHITVFRAILLWREFLKISAYKRDRLKYIRNDSDPNLSNLPPFQRKLSERTESFLQTQQGSQYNLYRSLLSVHFEHCIREFIFYPFIFIILINTPWNILELKPFIRKYFFNDKSTEFSILFKKFLYDFYFSVVTVALLLSVVKTYPVMKLIYLSFRKKLIGDERSISLYDLHYKNDYVTELKNLSGGIFKNFLMILMIILNVILVTRIFSVFRRLKAQIKRKLIEDYSKIKHFFDHKIKEVKPHFLHKSSCRLIASICEFLPPGNVLELSLTSKTLYNKTQMNLIWKNMFENYYRKKLKNSTNPEVYNLINEQNYSDFKTACKELSKYAGLSIKLTESQRDSLIGMYNILLEETVNSLIRIPHLVLIPAKLFSFGFYYVGKFILYLQLKFYETNLFKKFLKNSFILLKFDTIVLERNYANCTKERLFFDIQILGVFNLLKLILILVCNALSILCSTLIITLKAICFTRISIPNEDNINQVRFTYTEKLTNINNKFLIIWQHIIAVLISILHLIILFYPLVYFHPEGFRRLANKNFNISSSDSFKIYLNPMAYINFLQDALLILWNMGYWGRCVFLCGRWCINIIWYLLHHIIIKLLLSILSKSDVIVYDVVNFVCLPKGLLRYLIFNSKSFLNFALFPHVYIIKKSENAFIIKNIIGSLLINIIYLTCMVIPFYLNFRIELSFYRFIILNTYAVTNLIKLIGK